jgi:hypothetical protein
LIAAYSTLILTKIRPQCKPQEAEMHLSFSSGSQSADNR